MDRVRKGDMVVVIAGKEKGKRGKVLRIAAQDEPRGGRARDDGQAPHQAVAAERRRAASSRRKASIHISNVMPVDPGSDKATRVKVKRDEDGRAQRVAKSGTVIEAAK